MNNLTKEQRTEILDLFGKKVIEFRDSNLDITMNCATGKSINPIKAEQYSILSTLNQEQREAIFDLLSETITSTIYDFLDMVEANANIMKLLIIKDGVEYDMAQISEKMGGEISFPDEDGWIQKFSKIGRFVL